MNHPLPYAASERATGLATGPQVRYLAGNEDLLPMRLDDGADLLPAVRDAPVVRIGPQPAPTNDAPVVETRMPRREPSLEADAWVPGVQAVFTSIAAGIGAGLLAWAAGWSWKVPVVFLALGLALGWLWRLRVVDSLLWTIETWTGRDFNGDRQVGKPQTAFTVANPSQARDTVARETRQEAESAERAALLAFCDACFVNGCSEAAHGIKASGPDRAAFVTHRDALLSLGVAAWRNPDKPRAGWHMAVSRQRARQIITKHVL